MARTIICAITSITILACIGCGKGEQKTGSFLQRGKEYAAKKDYARAVLQFRNEAKLLPSSPEPYYQLGLVFLEMRDGRTAYAQFKKAVELDPNHAGAQLKLAEMTALNSNKELREEAQERAGKVLTNSPDNPEAMTVLALADVANGNEKAAESQLTKALNRAPANLKAATVLASLKMRGNDSEGAVATLRSAVDHNPKSPEAVIELGRLYMILKRNQDAAAQFQRATQLDPTNGAALMSLVQLQIATGHVGEAENNLRRASALPDKTYRTAFASYLYQSGRKDLAIQELENICRKDSADRESRTLLIQLYRAAKRNDDAERLLGVALKANSKDTAALLLRSEIYLGRGKIAEAQNDLAQVLRFTPDSAQAHRLMAQVHQARGAHLQGRQELAEALRLNPSLLDARTALAEEHLKARAASSALELLDKAPDGQKASLRWITTRAKVLVALNETTEAHSAIDSGLKLGRTRELLLLDSRLRLAQKDFAGARASAEEALKENPEDVAALELTALSQFKSNHPDVAIQRIRDQVALKPRSAGLRYFLALQLYANGRWPEARQEFDATLKADPNFFPATIELAKMEIAEGRGNDARQRLTPMIASTGAEIPTRLLLAQVESGAANYPAAIDHYRRVLSINPTQTIALNNLAAVLVEQDGNVDEGLRYAQQAKELVPNDPSVDDTLGWAFYRKGIYRTALQHLRSASLKTSDPSIKYHLAMAYFKAGEVRKAEETLAAALKQNPNLKEAVAAKQLIALR